MTNGTMGLACDRDGYDLRTKQCAQCGSRGCPKRDHCKTIPPQPETRAGFIRTWEEAAPISPEAWAALTITNRLYGAEINHEGDAI